MPLPSSFWVDEMGTAFVVRQGGDHPTFAVAPQVPASIYYALPAISQRLFGFSEVAYRIPSALVMLVALVFIYNIAVRLIHPDAGWFALFACMSFRGFNYQASDARPYALGTLVLAAGLWFLIRWLDSSKWRDALLFALCAALLWRVHLIFWPAYAAFGAYLLVRMLRKETQVRWGQVAVVLGLIGVALVPVLLQALELAREASAHVVAPQPTLGQFIYAVKFGVVAVTFGGAAGLGRMFGWPHVPGVRSVSAIVLIVGWWLCQPLGLLAYSWITGNSVFVPRYLSISLAGAALAGPLVGSYVIPPQYWKRLALAFGVGVLLFMGRWNQLWPRHDNSDWRTAASVVNSRIQDPNTPVLCPSPFIEARPPGWRPDYPLESFLYSHLQVYRLKGTQYPFPFESSPEAKAFATSLSQGAIQRSGRFFIYGGDYYVKLWREWFAAQPEFRDWSNTQLGPFGDVDVILFERP